jgi:hypothetical protein
VGFGLKYFSTCECPGSNKYRPKLVIDENRYFSQGNVAVANGMGGRISVALALVICI